MKVIDNVIIFKIGDMIRGIPTPLIFLLMRLLKRFVHVLSAKFLCGPQGISAGSSSEQALIKYLGISFNVLLIDFYRRNRQYNQKLKVLKVLTSIMNSLTY